MDYIDIKADNCFKTDTAIVGIKLYMAHPITLLKQLDS